MALFKIFKGKKENLPETKVDGYCYFTLNDSLFYIDYEDENGELQRKSIEVEACTDAEIDEICGQTIQEANGAIF